MQLSGGGGLRKTCILMQAHLTHGSLMNAAFVKRPCIDFKKFIERTLAHRDAAYYREAALAAKDFISFMKSGKDIYACIDAGNAKRTTENSKILSSIFKTVLFCASNKIPCADIPKTKEISSSFFNFAWMLGTKALKKHFARMAVNAK